MPGLTMVLLFAVATTILTVSPGPGVLYVAARSVAQGRRAGFASMLGIESGEIMWIVAAAIAVAIDSTYVLTAAAISGRLIRSPLAQRRTGRAAAATYLALGLAAAASGFRKP